MYRKLLTAATCAALVASPVLAEPSASVTPLPAGKPAGTKQADLFGVGVLGTLLITGAVVVGIVAATGGFDSKTTTATTGTGS